MTRPPGAGAQDDVSSVPNSVDGGMRPHVRHRLGTLARECVRSAERGEQVGAALALLAVLHDLGVKAGTVSA